jgi:tyrosyl-tRNA synthetase
MPTHAMGLPALLLDVLVESGLCKSKGDARRQIAQGAVRLGAGRDTKVSDSQLQIDVETVVWKGKKSCVRVVLA